MSGIMRMAFIAFMLCFLLFSSRIFAQSLFNPMPVSQPQTGGLTGPVSSNNLSPMIQQSSAATENFLNQRIADKKAAMPDVPPISSTGGVSSTKPPSFGNATGGGLQGSQQLSTPTRPASSPPPASRDVYTGFPAGGGGTTTKPSRSGGWNIQY